MRKQFEYLSVGKWKQLISVHKKNDDERYKYVESADGVLLFGNGMQWYLVSARNGGKYNWKIYDQIHLKIKYFILDAVDHMKSLVFQMQSIAFAYATIQMIQTDTLVWMKSALIFRIIRKIVFPQNSSYSYKYRIITGIQLTKIDRVIQFIIVRVVENVLPESETWK